MKTSPRLFLLAMMAFGFYSFSLASFYQINGKINTNEGMIYLKGFRNKVFYNIDSARIVKGQFNFKGNIQRPDLFGLSLNRNETYAPYYIFLEASQIQVDIDTNNKESARITGSAANDLFMKYHDQEGYRIDSLIKANPASPVVAYLLYRENAPQMSGAEIEASMALLDPSLNDLSYLMELKDIAAVKKKVDIGNPAIDFSGTTPDGKTVKLSDYFGNYLLIDFWASWCGPCRRENPNVVKAYNQFKSKGFSIFGVSLDRDKNAWMKAIAKDSLTWTHVSDLKFWDSAPAKLYGIRSIPSNVLLDPTGKIIARNLYAEDLMKKLAEIYK